ncbi:MAG TPA: hypothetical protein VEB70_06955 [Noviherbaspirillum sp.]|nr:hypothetical protein [Noviherbaspirillum sp.]
MRLLDADTQVTAATSSLVLSLAKMHQEVREAQWWRHRIFIEAAGRTGLKTDEAVDADEFHPY